MATEPLPWGAAAEAVATEPLPWGAAAEAATVADEELAVAVAEAVATDGAGCGLMSAWATCWVPGFTMGCCVGIETTAKTARPAAMAPSMAVRRPQRGARFNWTTFEPEAMESTSRSMRAQRSGEGSTGAARSAIGASRSSHSDRAARAAGSVASRRANAVRSCGSSVPSAYSAALRESSSLIIRRPGKT